MDTFEVIERFVDRERVDPDALKAALASDDGRSYLVDLLAIRETLLEQPDPVPHATPSSRLQRSGARLLLAAAASAIVAVGSYQWGLHTATVRPAQADVIEAVPSRTTPQPLSAAPAPTKVIYLEPGVDWYQVGVN